MTISLQLEHIQRLAAADAAGDAAAHQELLKAVRALQLAVETPFDALRRTNMQVLQNMAIRIALEKQWLHIIAAANGKSVSASEIADQSDTDVQFVARLFRLLTAIGICDETGYQTYAANETTRFRVKPTSVAAVKHHYDTTLPMVSRVVEYMRGPGLQSSFDDSNARNPRAWFELYPIEEKLHCMDCQPNHPLIVDIGGGIGHILEQFKQRYPDHPGRLILQDLPSTLQRSERQPDGVEAMGYDFFTPQPVESASIYILRHVLHNWSDTKSEQILRRVVDAMDPVDSTLLVVERVPPDQGADVMEASVDLLMWLDVSGMERTQRQWTGLLEKVGLQLVNVWRPQRGDCVLQVRVRR